MLSSHRRPFGHGECFSRSTKLWNFSMAGVEAIVALMEEKRKKIGVGMGSENSVEKIPFFFSSIKANIALVLVLEELHSFVDSEKALAVYSNGLRSDHGIGRCFGCDHVLRVEV
ncbi:BQ5605_C026g10186 [Microbotryum silenes-dioicae]|uniref:BQ5605_C026g10186 protein n=1 Tax=Microbotryum silenes-dioicae TaxID=796604 RepID=A0A2X0MQI0_9BASI|nr:BQ5605_C026g10186 [Microbotryum silenes-dioicae]